MKLISNILFYIGYAIGWLVAPFIHGLMAGILSDIIDKLGALSLKQKPTIKNRGKSKVTKVNVSDDEILQRTKRKEE